MSERVRGTVISVHGLGAAVRLDDGRIVAAPIGDVNANRATYTRALDEARSLPFDLVGKMAVVARSRVDEVTPSTPAPALSDPSLEMQIAAYLKETQSWAPADLPPPHERHLRRKEQRARSFGHDGV